MDIFFQNPGIGKESKKKVAQDQLMELIASRHFAPGDKLPSERELAQALGISRNILREAVASLASQGIIEVKERLGLFVQKDAQEFTIDSLQNLQMLPSDFYVYQMEVRMIISVPATELAALRRTEEDLRKLWQCFESFAACPYSTPEEQAQNGKWEALLHHLVTEAAHNPLLSRVNENINALVEKNNSLIHPHLLLNADWIAKIKDQHYRILKALEARNANEAGSVLKQHLLDSYEMTISTSPYMAGDLPYAYWTIS